VDYQVEHGWNIIRQPLGLPHLHCLRFRGSQPCTLRHAGMRNGTGGRLPHGVQQHEARLLPLRGIREHVHQQRGDRHAVLRWLRCARPRQHRLDPNLVTIIGVAAMFAKTFFFIFFFMWVRWTLPRFRFDQLMNLGWKGLIPLAILNILITGGVMLALGQLAP
jgi:hypothetical protein